jgi:hypothetical protein
MREIVVGRVAAIRRYPMMSMLGEVLEAVVVDQRGTDVLAEGEIRRGDPVRLIA